MITTSQLPKPNHTSLTRSKTLSEYIRQDILHRGPISFADFMEHALYHPQWGYYLAQNFQLGKSGDFITAPHLSPLFAQCIAKQFQQIFSNTDLTNIVEIGAGTGQFAIDVLRYLAHENELPAHYFIYEKSPRLQAMQQSFLQQNCGDYFSHIHWIEKIPDGFKGIIFANEVLDALSVHRFHIDKKQNIKELCVTNQKDSFEYIVCDPTSELFNDEVAQLQKHYVLAANYESEINLNLSSFIQEITSNLAQGILLFIDYGYGQREYYRQERERGTLMCFYQHHAHDNPFFYPGLQDITAHVDFTRLADLAINNQLDVLGFTTQASFLLGLGLMKLCNRASNVLSPTESFQMNQAIKRLTFPSEMGERVKVMGFSKHINLNLDLLGFSLLDRRRDL